MQTTRSMKPGIFKSLGLTLVAVFLLFSVASIVQAKKPGVGNTVVVFQSNWCANCRQITPLIQEIASQNGLSVQTIDVDVQDAPSQAQGYGLSIPSADLPQVYLVNQGRVTLLLDGRKYKFVKPDLIRTDVMSNLQQAKSN